MIPRSQTLKVEDFPDQSEWIEPIIRALNSGASQTSSALSKSLTFGENFNATIQTMEVTLKPAGDWRTPTMTNGWVSDGAKYRRVGDRVEIQGSMMSGTIGVAAFTLPEGFRPAVTLRFPTTSNSLFGQITVQATGEVTPSVGVNTSFALNCAFAVDGGTLVNGAFPMKFSHKLQSGAKPAGCWVIAVSDVTGSARNPASGSGFCAWRPNGSEVIVDDVPGLAAGHKYQVTFLVIGG
jgi:hypothetical protein